MHTFRELQIVETDRHERMVILERSYQMEIGWTFELRHLDGNGGVRITEKWHGENFISGHDHNGTVRWFEVYRPTFTERVQAIATYQAYWSMWESLKLKRPDIVQPISVSITVCKTTLGAIHTYLAETIIESIQLLDGKEVYTVDRPFCGKCEVFRQMDYPISFDSGVYTVGYFTMPESTPVIVRYRVR